MNSLTLNRTSPAAQALGLLLILALYGCGTTEKAPAPDLKAAETAIQKFDEDWVKAAQTLQPDAWVAFYSDDAVILPPNEKTATSREDIRKSIAGLLGLPGLRISWKPTKVEVAASGDLGYLYGTYDMSFDGPKGQRISDQGKILEIVKKQPDGSWKCIVDTWSSDLPAAPPPSK